MADGSRYRAVRHDTILCGASLFTVVDGCSAWRGCLGSLLTWLHTSLFSHSPFTPNTGNPPLSSPPVTHTRGTRRSAARNQRPGPGKYLMLLCAPSFSRSPPPLLPLPFPLRAALTRLCFISYFYSLLIISPIFNKQTGVPHL